jgi:hypothetical protein
MEEDLGMASIDYNIKIDVKQVSNDIYKDIFNKIKKAAPKIQRSLNAKIEDIVFQRLVSSVPTITGRDYYEMGVPDINERLQSIIRIAAKNFKIKVTPANILNISIEILEDDYSLLLSLPESVFPYISAKGSGILQWLKWILIEGNSPIVRDFEFTPTPSRFSRTGGGVMMRGGGWNVPSSLAGTSQNNILTRSLQGIEKDIESLVSQELQRIIT